MLKWVKIKQTHLNHQLACSLLLTKRLYKLNLYRKVKLLAIILNPLRDQSCKLQVKGKNNFFSLNVRNLTLKLNYRSSLCKP